MNKIMSTFFYSAPVGCRQYYMGAGGTITSFGFSATSVFLQNQDYSACIRQEEGT